MAKLELDGILDAIRTNMTREDRLQSEQAQPPQQSESVESVQHVDEKRVVETYGGEQRVLQDVEQTKCPSCGAGLVFDPVTGTLYCPYCETRVPIYVNEAAERDLTFEEDQAERWSNETRVFRCANCGAETVFEKTEFAKKCVFCGSASVTCIDDIEGVRPNAVIPFAIDAQTAKKTYSTWIKKRTFAPRSFKHMREDAFSAVYCPSWTFDTQTYSHYHGVVGDYYYVTVGSGKNRRTETRVRYRNVSGTHHAAFDDIHINSARMLTDSVFKKLQPFHTRNAVGYNQQFLAGYTAEHYTRPLTQGWVVAKEQIDSAISSGIRNSLRCDVVSSLHVSTNYDEKKFKYLLLPVYVCYSKFKGKMYNGFVNGENGKVVAKYPISPLRVLATIGLGLLVAIGLAVFLYLSNGG